MSPHRTSISERRGARRTTGPVVLLACGLLLAAGSACRVPGTDDGQAVVRRTITIGLPSQHVDVRPIVGGLTEQRLVGTGPDGRPTPGLLESWSRSEDGRVWDFVLRKDVRSHDGGAVSAEDVATLVRRQMAEDPPAGLLDVERIEATDDKTLRVHLREPSSLLFEALTLTKTATRTGAFMPGPGTIEPMSSPTLMASSASSAAASVIDGIVFRRYESPRAAWSALMRDEIDLLYEVSGEARPFLEQAHGIEVRPFLRPFVITLGLNVRHAALRHRDVRRALNHAVDRETLLAQDFGGRGLVAAGQVWPRHWAADPSIQPYAFDPYLARRLFDDAGLRAVGRADGRPSRFRITCLVIEDIPRLERVALRLRRAYAHVGVDLALEVVSQETLGTRLGAGDFEAFLAPVMSGYGPNPVYHMWGQHPLPRFVDHGYVAAAPAAEQVRRAHTDAQLRAALPRLQRVLFDDPPAVLLVWEESARAVGRRFVVPPSLGRDILSTLASWRPSGSTREAAR